ITRDRQIVYSFRFFLVITTSDHAVLRVAESNRKDPAGWSGSEWCIGDSPRATTVRRPQHTRLSRRARSDPCVRLSEQRDVSATRSERAFIPLRRWQVRGRHTRPRTTAVSSGEYVKLLIN